jgi:hypothetical protein
VGQKKRDERFLHCTETALSDDGHSFVHDLRINNGFERRFDAYFDLPNNFVEIQDLKLDDRRHGDLERLPTWWSGPHFMRQVREYHTEMVASGEDPKFDHIFPSEPFISTLFTPFMPANPYRGKTDFTGRLFVARVMQRRSLHKHHMDEHWCLKQRKLVQEICVWARVPFEAYHADEGNGGDLRDELADVFVKCESDDKAKIPLGHPGYVVATNMRAHGKGVGHRAIQGAADHDLSKLGSVTTSVNLFTDIPKRVEESWVQGDVKASVNDSVFHASSGWKHTVQLLKQLLGRACVCAGLPHLPSLAIPSSRRWTAEYDAQVPPTCRSYNNETRKSELGPVRRV